MPYATGSLRSAPRAARYGLFTRNSNLRRGSARPSTVARAPHTARTAVDPAAYDVYLRGRFLFEQHAAIEAIACFERVVALDPNFAVAHAWCALSNMLAANLNLLPALTADPRGRSSERR